MPFGEPQRLGEDVIAKVEESLRVNPSWRAAAEYAGCSDRTLRLYRDVFADNDERPADDELAQYRWDAAARWFAARSAGERELIDAIRAAIEKDWRAAESLLKKGWPDRYNERIELTGADGAALIPDAEEMQRRIDAAYERARAKDDTIVCQDCGQRQADRPDDFALVDPGDLRHVPCWNTDLSHGRVTRG